MKLENKKEPTGVVCPFCGEDDFDLPGLAWHIQNYCNKYSEALHIMRSL